MNRKWTIGCIIAAMALAGGLMAASRPDGRETVKNLDFCHSKINTTLSNTGASDGKADYSMMPRCIKKDSSRWELRKVCPEEWCSGFWPGVLWYDYENTNDPEILKQARNYTESMARILERPVFDHDLGFLINCSVGNGYRLTRDNSYKRILLAAADSLATLYNPKAGTLLSWPRNIEMFNGHNTIMDNMINLELLFWAAKNGGNPYLYDIAVNHAETTMKNQFRPDYTCYHVAVYDIDNGDFKRGCNHQGYDDNSVWARGHGWAIYGYTMVYRETGDKRFLDFVQKVTDKYLADLPDDMVPYWDFSDPKIPDAPRDASAAALVASALFELSDYVDADKKTKYISDAKKMLASLSSEKYRAPENHASFLLHSVGNLPANSEIDASIIYADYYYIEALTRLNRLEKGERVCPTETPAMAQASTK